ncbi:MAG: hypothetical protein ACLR3C_11425 [Eggerthella lenta]
MTNGTASPENIDERMSSATSTPTAMPPKYRPTITAAPFAGKNAAVKNA